MKSYREEFMRFEIGVSYQEDIPSELVLDTIKELEAANVKVESERRPIAIYAGVEWSMPALFILFVLSSYAKALLSEAGKEHYPLVKKAITNAAKKALKIKTTAVASSSSPNKLTKNNPVSRSFSLVMETLDGKALNFLFFGDRDESFYDTCCNEMFKVLLAYSQEYPDDDITNQVRKLSQEARMLCMVFDEDNQKWKITNLIDNALNK